MKHFLFTGKIMMKHKSEYNEKNSEKDYKLEKNFEHFYSGEFTVQAMIIHYS